MKRNAKEFEQKAKEKGITKWNMHDCSICGYKCGYIIRGDKVTYDPGCDCVNGPERESSWDHLADHYNRNQRENNEHIEQKFIDEMDEFWGFNK